MMSRDLSVCCCRAESLQSGYALVRYDELDMDDEATEKLAEWFPLPGGRPPRTKASLPGPYQQHTAPEYVLRPQPPPQVCGGGGGASWLAGWGSCALLRGWER